MTVMLNRFKHFLAAPVFDDEEKTREAALLTTMLRAVFLGALAIGPISIALSPGQATLKIVFSAVLLAVFPGLFVFARLGWVQFAARLLPMMLWLVITASLLTYGGIRNPAVSAYLIVIVSAGLLSGEVSALVYSLLSGLALLGILYGEKSGLLRIPFPAASGLGAWVLYAGIFGTTAVLLNLAVRRIREGIESTRPLHAAEKNRSMELDSLLSAERKRARQMELLADMARQIAGITDSQVLLEEAARRLEADFGFEHVGFLLKEGDELVKRVGLGAFARLLPEQERVPLQRGIVGRVGATGQSYLSNDTASDSVYVQLPGVRMGSELAVPMRIGAETVGVLDVESEHTGAFDATDVSTLESLANLLAAGLQKSELFRELQARERMAEALRMVGIAITASLDLPTVLEAICDETRQAFAADGVIVWLVEGEELFAAAARGPAADRVQDWRMPINSPRSIAARAVRERTPSFVNDLQNSNEGEPSLKAATGAQAILTAPILHDAEVLGVFSLLDTHNPRRFGPRDLAAVEALGAQAAVAIHNARLLERERRRAAQMSLLNEVSRLVAGTLDEEELFNLTVDALVYRLGYVEAAILVPAPDSPGDLILAALSETEPMGVTPGIRQSLGEGVIGRAAQIHETYLANDISKDPYYFNPLGRRSGSALAVPLLREATLLAVLYTESSQPGAFSPEDVAALETLANHAATALQNARLYARSRDRLREMAALQTGARTLASSLELRQLFQTVVELLKDTFGYNFVSIYQRDGDLLRLGAQTGYPANMIIHEIPRGAGVSWRAVLSGQTQFVPDVRADPDFLRAAHEVESEICVPLLKEGVTLGTLNVESGPDRLLTEADVELLNTFAGQVTLAIDNARLFEAEREQRELAEALREVGAALTASLDFDTVLDCMLEQIARVVPYDAANVMLLNADRTQVRIIRARGYERFGEALAREIAALTLNIASTPNLRRLVETGMPHVIPDTSADPHWVRVGLSAHVGSWAGAPIVVQGENLALFSLDKIEPGFYSLKDVKRLEAFTSQAALALQNARLFESEQSQRRLAESMRDIAAALNSTLDLNQVLDHVLEGLAQLIPFDSSAVLLPEGDHLRVVAGRGFPDLETQLQLRLPGDDDSLIREILHSRAPVVLADARADPRFHQWGETSYVRGWIGVPLISRDRVVGYLTVDSRTEGAYGQREAEIAFTFASQAAIAIENAHLHRAEKDRAQELDAQLKADAALLSTLDLEPLLDNILSAALAAVPAADKGAILLLDAASGLLQIRALAGYTDPRVRTLTFTGPDSYSARALRERMALYIPDARNAPGIPAYAGEIEEVREILSAIVAPLMLRDQPLGVISLDSVRRSTFDQSDLRLLVAFANKATLAIDNARLHAEVQTLAVTNSLTGLANRRAFDRVMERETARAERYGHPLSLVILDIDDFKVYNDTYGHPAGDARLKAIANLLKEAVRDPDVAARYGGEEFGLILPHTGKAGAMALAERIRTAAEAATPHPARTAIPGYTLSAGVASYPEDGLTPEALLLAADNAELKAKHSGKNRVEAAGGAVVPHTTPAPSD